MYTRAMKVAFIFQGMLNALVRLSEPFFYKIMVQKIKEFLRSIFNSQDQIRLELDYDASLIERG